MMTLPEAITAVRAGRKLGKIRCPVSRNHKHGDRSPSLNVFIGNSGWVAFKCWSADCTTKEILAAAGLKGRDIGPDRPFEPKQARKPRNLPKAAPAALPALCTPPDPEKVAQRALWPRLMVPEAHVVKLIADRRGICQHRSETHVNLPV